MQVEIPGPKFGLNEIIDTFTQDVMAKNDKKWSPIRPSSAGKCERELGYEQMEYRGFADYPKEQKSSSVHRLLNFGHSVERHVIDEMYKAFAQSPDPIKIAYKQQMLSFFRLPDGTLLEGSSDLGIESKDWKILVDVKSKGDKYSQFYKSSWDEFVEKLEATGFAKAFGSDAVYITDLEKFLGAGFDPFFCNNLYQLNFYARNSFFVERGYNLASIVQLNKNDSRLREIRFTPSQEVYERTKTKFEKVMSVIDLDKNPEALEKEYVLGSSKCGFCSFRKQCWPEDDALKAFFKQLPAKQWPKDLDRLPSNVQEELRGLFDQYHSTETAGRALENIEQSIVKVLDKNKIYKIRLSESQIYRVKRLKSGGANKGDRMVLRRDKA